jgi:hypothetical protein
MNPTSVRNGAGRSRWLLFFGVSTIAVLLLSGCGTVKEYSIRSWQGPLPLHDMEQQQLQGG